MNTAHIKSLIPLFLDNQLTAEENAQVKSHLKVCPSCLQEFKIYEKLHKILGEWDPIEPRPDHMAQFWTKLAGESSSSKKSLGFLEQILSSLRERTVLVPLLIILFAGFFIFHRVADNRNTQQQIASLNSDQIEFVRNIDLASDYDVIENMDLVEDLEVLEKTDLGQT